jgi:hypothetical protein
MGKPHEKKKKSKKKKKTEEGYKKIMHDEPK